MARPRKFDRENAVEGALQAFWASGYLATSMEDLKTATGLQPGSIYAAFSNKDTLFKLSIESYVSWLKAELQVETRGIQAIEEVLSTVTRLTLADSQRRGCPLINAIPEAIELSAETNKVINDGLAAMRRTLRRHLKEAMPPGFPVRKLNELEALLFAATTSIRVLGRAKQPKSLLKSIADSAVRSVKLEFAAFTTI